MSFDVDAAKERLRNNADAFDVKAEWISVVEQLHLPKDSHLISTLMNVYNEATGLSGEALAIGGGTYARSPFAALDPPSRATPMFTKQ